MTVERGLRLLAGTFVLLSLALGYWVTPYWFLFTAFVGLNLFQSALTNWRPMMTFLRKLGARLQRSPSAAVENSFKSGPHEGDPFRPQHQIPEELELLPAGRVGKMAQPSRAIPEQFPAAVERRHLP